MLRIMSPISRECVRYLTCNPFCLGFAMTLTQMTSPDDDEGIQQRAHGSYFITTVFTRVDVADHRSGGISTAAKRSGSDIDGVPVNTNW